MISQATFDAALDLTREWCAIPSVKGDERQIGRQADALVAWLRTELGATIVSAASANGRPPVIHARIDAGAAKTVIFYNMYDVMPASPEGWSVDPFKGDIVDLDGIGTSYVARGAENNKGPLAGMLLALKALIDADRLQVNVEILVDGEEESGSGAMRDYLADPNCPVRQSASAIFPSFCEYGGGAPRVYLGFSGIAKGEVRVDGGTWGGPKAAIHSSNAPWIANPAARLVDALSLIGKPPTGELAKIAIDDEAAGIIAALAGTFDPAAELRFRKTEVFSLEGDARALLDHVMSTASFNISSLETMPLHSDGVIPHGARAAFELRTPPSLDPADFLASYRQALETRPGAVLSVADSYPGFRFRADASGVSALLRSYETTANAAPQIWPWAIGAAPAYAFAPHARSFLLGGAGRGGNAHGIDEFMTLEGFRRFIQSMATWLDLMGREADAE
ncbi:Acetylornithine deacetylase/Succinyl-diaminopimelate desuccinylase [Rhizobium sp. NFR07]|uniref:M20/M25/M40 family metallo-hydrolase n=1 Tax=Rhizobium sp. NFR07 TaxID=1566262 RepID=UPI0008E41CEF|nr:M20/M25/M40 family metallo-hydrolase [Rhizobium sp. NFR07]SFB55859.1 Acetylornithine deacetylase/Succinyl-diaminopimelate desuccinylase [Rhizobium sp. NFR07]